LYIFSYIQFKTTKDDNVKINKHKILVIVVIISLGCFIGIGNYTEIQTQSGIFTNHNNSIAPAILKMDTSLASAEVSFIGESKEDQSGVSVASAGDVNGDGYDDFLIGASYYNASKGNEGKTYLFFGDRTNSWSRGMSCSQADASFIGENEGDQAGGYVAGVGDVNGDGYDDILINAFLNDDAKSEAGKVYLIFGRESGWVDNFNLTNANASFVGEYSGDKIGMRLAGVGDVNGDEVDDFLISSKFYNASKGEEGKTYLFFGNTTNIWTQNMNCSTANASFIGEHTGDLCGFSLGGGGDINNDGYDDFLIGAIGDDTNENNAGKVYLFLGNTTDTWSKNKNCSEADASFLGEGEAGEGGYLGYSIAGEGDVNNDGFDDLLISAGYYDNDTGKSYLIFGRTSDWSRNVNITNANASFVGEHESDTSGFCIAFAGDSNNDGYDDFLIGASTYNASKGNEGKIYLFFGDATDTWTKNVNCSEADASFIGESQDDKSGKAVAGAGDINGDGLDDILIGVSGNDDGGQTAGKTYLIFGVSPPPQLSLLLFMILQSPEKEGIPVYPFTITLPVAVSTIIVLLIYSKRHKFNLG
jgi:hypothetical protein